MKPIPLSRVHDSKAIREAIARVVDSGSFILGPQCRAFETELAEYLGVPHFVLANSCTSAMHLLFLALGFPPGSEVLLPSLTAFPSVEPVCHAGLRPIFVDVDETFCMDPRDMESKVSSRSVAILPVHLYGQAADLARIQAVADRRGLMVLEDCAQAIGATFGGRRVGGFGKAAGFSFYPSKNLTVYGDGGGIATADAALAATVSSLRDHGRTTKYRNDQVGFNMRFNEIQAAVGRCQLKLLDELNGRRFRLASLYRELLAGLVDIPIERADAEHVYHLFVIQAERRDELQAHLKAKGIQTGVHYPVPVHQQPAIEKLFGRSSLPVTERVVRRVLSLPLYPDLSEEDVRRVARAIREFYHG